MSIRERKNKDKIVYEVRFKYRNKYGISKYYSKSGFAKKKDAKNHELYIKEQIRQGNFIEQEMTFDQVFLEHIKYDTSLSDSTKEIRTVYYNKHIKKVFGDTKINLIDFRLVQDFFNSLKDDYSKATNENILKCLNSVFRFAYNCGYINRLPYAKITVKGKKMNKKQKVLSTDVFEGLIEQIENSKQFNTMRFKSYRIALYIGYYTGLRIGEVCSLDKEDIDFNNMQISVNKNLYIKDKEIHIKETKTVYSDSIIPMHSHLAQLLEEWFEENTSEHVIVDNDLNYLNPALLKGYILNYSRRIGQRVTFHMLRHTYATTLWRNKVDPKIAQTLLRHENINTTLSIYTHLDNENLNDVIEEVFKN